MHRMRIIGITDWLKMNVQKDGSFTVNRVVYIGKATDGISTQRQKNVHNLPEDYYRRGLQGKTDDWIKVNLANEYGFVSSGKPVHPLYTDSIQCMGGRFISLVLISLSYWVLISVAHLLARFFSETVWGAGSALMSFA